MPSKEIASCLQKQNVDQNAQTKKKRYLASSYAILEEFSTMYVSSELKTERFYQSLWYNFISPQALGLRIRSSVHDAMSTLWVPCV